MIKKLKTIMYQYINKYGINSQKTVDISQQLDIELNRYYESSSMKYFYEQSKKGILEYFHDFKKYPNSFEWNSYAKEKDYLSFISIEYMSRMNFDFWCNKTVEICTKKQ